MNYVFIVISRISTFTIDLNQNTLYINKVLIVINIQFNQK